MEKKPVELSILGPTELVIPGVADAGHLPPKRLALLAYLAIESAAGFKRRDQITGLLWPELPQEGARTQLRKALSALREQLGPEVILTRGETEIKLDSAQLWCDAAALQDAMSAGNWEKALSLYRGDLLEGLFTEGVEQEWEDWLTEKRRALKSSAARAAWECSHLEDEKGDWKAAAVKARRALELEPDDEAGVRRLMTLLDSGGDRAGALRVYSELRNRLRAEYGVEPAPETRKLARKVQAARKGESHETPPLPEIIVQDVVSIGSEENAHRNARSHIFLWFILFGFALLLIGYLAGVMSRGIFRSSLPPRNSLAVLPMHTIGSGVTNAAFTISEEMATALTLDSGVVVIPTSRSRDAFACRGDAGCIRERLNVAYYLNGGIQGDGKQIRVTMRLVRTCDGAAVWGNMYDAVDSEASNALQRIAGETAKAVANAMLQARSHCLQ